MNGVGLFIWKEGHKYFGDWKDDKFNGKGKYTWTTGDYFEGNYENDKKEGLGEYYFHKKKVFIKGIMERWKKEWKIHIGRR